jgi:hypothetical protein
MILLHNILVQMPIINFINEIGNKIKIGVQRYFGQGTNHKTKETVKFTNGVKITIIGPTSEMNSMITMEEAVQLHKCLGDYLTSLKPTGSKK